MKNNQKTKKQHYVPRFYLSEFVDDDNKLTVFDFQLNKQFKIDPKNYGYENHLYETPAQDTDLELGKYALENQIEKIFSNYEGDFAELLKKIKTICTLTQNPDALILKQKEKILLYKFIINMIIRNPCNMEILQLNEVSSDINNSDWMISLRKELDNIGLDGIDSLVIAAQKIVMLTEEIPDSFPRQCTDILKKFPFHLFFAREGEFVTSNLPVCLCDDLAVLGEDKTCVYFPILPKVAVIVGNYNAFRKRSNRMTIIERKYVDNFNKVFILKCREYGRSIVGRDMGLIKQYVNGLGCNHLFSGNIKNN